MGFSLYGLKPKNKTGKYFHAAMWEWEPISTLVWATCGDIMDLYQLIDLGMNNGERFSQEQTDRLVARLTEVVSDNQRLADAKEKVKKMLKEQYDEDSWSEETIHGFIKFMKASGGFEVC
jgi:hypothetical protein